MKISQSALSFSQALEALKDGDFISRDGWNGKGMYLFLLKGDVISKDKIFDPVLKRVVEKEFSGQTTFTALGSIRMLTTDSTGRRAILTGWLASQSDLLSNDWCIVKI